MAVRAGAGAESSTGCGGVRDGAVKGLHKAGEMFFSGIASLGLPSVGKCHLSKWGRI